MMSQPSGRGDRGSGVRAVRWQGWAATAVLTAAWIGLRYLPGMHSSWIWLGRAAIFFIGAAVLWFTYDPGEPDEGV
jgi:hypothetical protein